ncbi:MAG: ABC transporter permease [Bacteroidaceae bacterium]|nr:ABC transporter permease [Bacteroidaceae bacterium]
MGTTIDISYWGLGIGMLLLLVPICFFHRFKTGLVKATVVGAVRMVVQLFLIGIYLKYLFLWDNPWINFLWVFIMVYVATETALSRTRLKRSILMLPLIVGFLASAILVGLYFLGVVLQLDNIFGAQYMIPIFGILMGNMLSSNVIALNTFYTNLMRDRQLYYYLLGNGASRFEAIAPFVREAIIKAFSPAIANMAVMGLVALPGTMIGQILGGSSPNVAIKYQMMIIVITVAASILSLMITLWLGTRKTFDAYGCIRQVFKE